MQASESPPNEAARLARLRSLGLLDTPAEEVLDAFTRLAASATSLPVALVALVDAERQWFKSALGAPQGLQTPRTLALSARTICHEGVFEVEDASAHPLYRASPMVTQLKMAHYAGAPLRLPGGEAIGALCVMGPQPGRLEPQQRLLLAQLADATVQVILLRERERQLARQRLLESIIEHLPGGLAVFDRELRHVVSNSTARRLLELPDSLFEGDVRFETLARYLAERGGYGDGDPQAAVQQRLAQIAAREPRSAERTLPSGTVVEIRDTFMPDGALISIYSDVTAARRAAAELHTSRERLARALEASGLGLWEYDLVSGAVHLSQSWARLLDFPEQDRQVRVQDVLPLFPAHELGRIQATQRRLLKGEIERFSVEHQMTSATGELVWFHTEAQVIERGPDGRARKVVGTCKDVSARRQAEQRIEEALRAADQASQAKSEFLATMSHEIRTPLNGVVGLTQLLAASDLPQREAESVTMIDSCAKSLLSLVDNILDFSKIEAGRLSLDEVPTDLAQLVREVSDVFRVRAAEKGLRFDVRQDPQLPRWIAADPGRLRQILLNLLGNALKFTASGGFSLEVSLQQAGPGQDLTFAVFDTGIGISAADQARLFTRFTQADASASRAHSGTGLGLAISRQLAQMMGGDVTLASRKEHGSTFTLRVPLRLAPAPPATQAQTVRPVRRHARILLAEDNEVNQLVAQRLLASLGYEDVTTVFTGREAVHACSEHTFDLVLMDCQMPVMDGWEATRALRRSGVQAPVLAFTASATSADRAHCLEAGMNDYLAKPVELAVLAEKVQRWLAEAPVSTPAHAAPAAPAAPALQVFDRSVLSRLFLDDQGLFAETRELFIGQTTGVLQALAVAGEPPDFEPVRKAMHSIRGAASMLGAEQLAACCAQLEEAAQEAAPASAGAIAAGCDAVRAAFDAFVAATRETASDSTAAGNGRS